MALAIMVPPKGKASTEPTPKADLNENADNLSSQTAPPHLTGRWDFSRLFTVEAEPTIVGDAEESAQKAQHIAQDAWRMTFMDAGILTDAAVEVDKPAVAAEPDKFSPKPMSFEEIRLWLQSFNAGPYATLKYEGNVPYQETRNYIPRVMKNYEQDLNTDYDVEINAAAAKYGLDPQMIRAIMKTESDFNNQTVSHAGARGLMQVMPVVWKDVKEKYDLNWEYSTGVFEPQKNIEVACAYLAWLRYDFLPRHFDAYEANPQAPFVLVRDRDRGVPDRESARIVVKAIDTIVTPAASTEVASVNVDVKKIVLSDSSAQKTVSSAQKTVSSAPKTVSKSNRVTDSKNQSDKETVAATAKLSDKKDAKPKIEISDAGSVNAVKKSSSNGKTRVVVRGGSGKVVSISVGDKGKVAASKSAQVEKASAKVAAHSHDDKDHQEIAKGKRKSVAKADNSDDKTQGG